jgi:hypothetical protein
MTPERLRCIEQVFDAAAHAEPSERAGVLTRLCGDDSALRAEVESLLAASTNADERILRAIRREVHLIRRAKVPATGG